MIITNINDYAKYYDSEVDRLKHDVYTYTDCGAWINWDNDTMSIGSIVEGSDAEFAKTFSFPVDSEAIDNWINELEKLAYEAWEEANCRKENNMKNALFINGNRDGYSPDQCYSTLTVEELIDILSDFDPDAEVFLNNDNGYTYGSIGYDDIYSGRYDEEDVEFDW